MPEKMTLEKSTAAAALTTGLPNDASLKSVRLRANSRVSRLVLLRQVGHDLVDEGEGLLVVYTSDWSVEASSS